MSHIYKVLCKEEEVEHTVKLSSPIFYNMKNGKPILSEMFMYDMERHLNSLWGPATKFRLANLEIVRVEYSGYDL